MKNKIFPAYSSETYAKIPEEMKQFPCIVTDGWDNLKYEEGTRSAYFLIKTEEGVAGVEMAIAESDNAAVAVLMELVDYFHPQF